MGEPETRTRMQRDLGNSSALRGGRSELFAAPPPEPSNLGKMVGAAIVVVAIAAIALALIFRGSGPAPTAGQNKLLPADPYAHSLVLTQLAMSQSTSLSGGKSTFIDGRIKNNGAETLTDVTIQVIFRNEVRLPPEVEAMPLTLIRTHEPYVDTLPVSSAPLKPGDDAEFRLIFEKLSGNWDQQMPELVVTHVAGR